jgi:DNA invertase Pin-like site-specific DNA recombinase
MPDLITPRHGAASVPDRSALGWAVYARLSARKYGRAKKRRNHLETVQSQIADIRAYAAQKELPISDKHIFKDNHLSAWKKNGKRPAFDDMITACINGEVCGILVWKFDRFTRRTRDALMFIDLAGKHGILIDGPISGSYDLRDPEDRKNLRDAASAAEYESDNISLRVTDKLGKKKAMGLQWGPGRTFGFEILSEAREADDDLMPIQRDEDVKVIREMARRATSTDGGRKPETWAALARDLNKRGITTATGAPWRASTLARMVRHPRNAGRLTRKDGHGRTEIVGTMPDRYPDYEDEDTGTITPGKPYVPILDAETYARLQGKLMTAKQGRTPNGSYPLTGALLCGRCGDGRTLAGAARGAARPGDARRYKCPDHNGGCGMSVRAADVEAMVKDAVLKRSANPKVRADIDEEDRALDLAREGLREQLAAAAAEVDRLDEEDAALEVRRANQTPPLRERAYRDTKNEYVRLIARAEARVRELTAELGKTPAGGEGDVPALTAEEWEEMGRAGRQRDLVRRLHLRVTVYPARPRLPGAKINAFDPRRIVIE